MCIFYVFPIFKLIDYLTIDYLTAFVTAYDALSKQSHCLTLHVSLPYETAYVAKCLYDI